MALFRRKAATPAPTAAAKPGAAAPASSEPTSSADQPVGETTLAAGPFDSGDEVPENGPRVDLGSLRVPVISGMQVRMELDQASKQITGVTVMLPSDEGVSALQLQAFAAPKKSGIWDEIREEIAAGIQKTDGTVDDVPGVFGRELIAHINRRTPGGETEVRKARFIGHDGPRWFLRGVMTGPAAAGGQGSEQLEDIFRNVVVVRDDTPKPPRDLLALTLPGQAEKLPGNPDGAPPNFEVPKRGPEITEIH